MGLEYEGNFPSPAQNARPEDLARYLATPAEVDPQEHMRLYLHENPHVRWGQDYTAWLLGRNSWVFAATDPQGLFEYGVGVEDVLALLKGLPGGRRLVIHVHPCYYGFRTAEDQDPLPWEKACCAAAAPLVSQLDLANIKCDVGDLANGVWPPVAAHLEAGWRKLRSRACRESSRSWPKSAFRRGRTTASWTPQRTKTWEIHFLTPHNRGKVNHGIADSSHRQYRQQRLQHCQGPAPADATSKPTCSRTTIATTSPQPEWEDADIEPVRFADPNVPDWSHGGSEGLSRGPTGTPSNSMPRPGGGCASMPAKDLLRVVEDRLIDGEETAAAAATACAGRCGEIPAEPARANFTTAWPPRLPQTPTAQEWHRHLMAKYRQILDRSFAPLGKTEHRHASSEAPATWPRCFAATTSSRPTAFGSRCGRCC